MEDVEVLLMTTNAMCEIFEDEASFYIHVTLQIHLLMMRTSLILFAQLAIMKMEVIVG